jgi:hypothetical protein
MSQNNDSFWNYSIHVQNKNSILFGTPSNLDDVKLCHQLEAGITEHLSKRCTAEKVNKVIGFKDWLAEVTRVDDYLDEECKAWEAMNKASCDQSHKLNILSEPSRRYNAPFSQSTQTSSCPTLPKLTNSECSLLYNNEGCLKCCSFFIDHCSATCKNDFPSPIGYKTLTQADIDRAKKPKGSKAISSILLSQENFDPYQNVQVHLVATILATSSQPFAYSAMNSSAVLSGDDTASDDNEVCTSTHLFWSCAAFSPNVSFSVRFDALIDNGSHTVLIRLDYATQLSLPRSPLKQPQQVKLAMAQDGQRVKIELTESVILSLFDPVSSWSAKPIKAIVCDGLCSPVMLRHHYLTRLCALHHRPCVLQPWSTKKSNQ